MRIALVLSHYFPHGGMQRDFLGIARELSALGHCCVVYCQSWRGEVPDGIELRQLPARRCSNHRRLQRFLRLLQTELAREAFDSVVGFEKMPGLDICFVPDACFVERARQEHGALYRYTSRYRHFSSWEKAVFDPRGKTRILCVSPGQQSAYQNCYDTPAERMDTLPAGILNDRHVAQGQRVRRRKAMREQLGLVEGELALLFVGSAFNTKGLDRVITAFASLRELQPGLQGQIMVVGEGRKTNYKRLARRLGVASDVKFLGGRTDVIELMSAADLMLHPARTEAGGAVLLEALVAELPVITSANCGHAHHISAARAGIVLPQPFEQSALNAALARCVDGVFRVECRNGADAYVLRTDLFSMHTEAARMITKLLPAQLPLGESNA